MSRRFLGTIAAAHLTSGDIIFLNRKFRTVTGKGYPSAGRFNLPTDSGIIVCDADTQIEHFLDV